MNLFGHNFFGTFMPILLSIGSVIAIIFYVKDNKYKNMFFVFISILYCAYIVLVF